MSRVSKNLRSPRMSLRSRLTEEQFRSTDYRSLWTKRSNEEWIKHIERVRHMSDDPYPNPGDWIGQRVDEYWIDGMQVFCRGSPSSYISTEADSSILPSGRTSRWWTRSPKA